MIFLDALTQIREFMSEGGDVLWIILAVTILLWALIVDRILFFRYVADDIKVELVRSWEERSDKASWFALRVREALISRYQQAALDRINTIKTLVSLCPLLGLLGTVSGMISVFDVMALTGTGNARLMASGISMATIPTMAGMVAALSGLYFGSLLEKKAKSKTKELSETLSIH